MNDVIRTSKYRVESTKCDCHPETCCCSAFTLWNGPTVAARGNDPTELQTLADLANRAAPVIRSSKERLLAQIVHDVLHLLEDCACENAQTGVTTVEISVEDWTSLNYKLDLISDDPHEALHDLISAKEPPALPEASDPDISLAWQTFLMNQAMLTSRTLLIAHAAFAAAWHASKSHGNETSEHRDAERYRYLRERVPFDRMIVRRTRINDHGTTVYETLRGAELDHEIDESIGAPTLKAGACPPFDATLNASIEAIAKVLQEEAASDPTFPVRGLANYAGLAGRIIRAVAGSKEKS